MNSGREAPLGELCSFRHGGTPSKSRRDYWGGQIPWVSPKDMKVTLLTTAEDSITDAGVEGSATAVVPEGSILVVVRSGILAHTLPVARVGSPVAFNQDIKGIQVTSNRVTPEYIFWFLRAKEPEVLRQGVKKGATVHSLASGFLESLRVPLHSLDEQRRIVDLLSRAENIVQMRREAEKKAKEIIPALFLDMFGDPATNPKGWENRPVGDVIRSAEYGTSTKASEVESGVPVIRMGNVESTGRLSLADLKYVVLPEDEQRKYTLQSGDILFNRTNSKDLVGKTGIWRGDTAAVAASYFIRVRLNEEIMLPDYFWAFMNTSHMKSVLYLTARGAIGQSNINAQELRAFVVPSPPRSLQKTFARRVDEALDLEGRQSLASSTARTAFQSLLAGMFQG